MDRVASSKGRVLDEDGNTPLANDVPLVRTWPHACTGANSYFI